MVANKNPTQFKAKDPWDAATEAWLMKSVARGIPQVKLFRQLTGKLPERPENVAAWQGEYETFKKRMKAMTRGNAVGMQEHRKKSAQRKLANIDFDSVAGQLEFLRTLITDVTLSADAKMRAFDRFVGMQGKSADSEHRSLLQTPEYCEITSEDTVELLLFAIREAGGAAKLDVSKWPTFEVRQLADAMLAELQRREFAEITSTMLDLSSPPEELTQKGPADDAGVTPDDKH